MSRPQRLALTVNLVAALAACGGSNPATMMPTADVPATSGDAAPDAGPPRVLHLSGGSFAHTCALLSTGRVRCWGVNDNGQLGVSIAESRSRCRVPESTTTLPCDPTPRDVPDLADVADLAVGNGGTCVVKRDGTVWCWGTNDVGELGQGTNDTSPHPTPVQVALPPARQVAYGAFHVCALLVDNTVQCWGNNKFGQVGLAPASSDTQCDPGDGLTAGCQRRPRAVDGLAGVRQVTAGRNHTCALLNDGTVRCWGLNQLGQVGNGMLEADTAPRVAPTEVTGLTDVTQVSAGGSHTCAVRSDGTVHCWGWNNLGQLGAASRESCQGPTGSPFTCARTATRVPELSGVRHLAAGRFHTCAALTDGGVRCAGRNDEFQLGLGVVGREMCSGGADTWACTRTFSEVTIPATREVAVGNYHACAALNDGTVRCWGAGYYGQIGDGATTNREGPVAASNLP